MKESSIGIFDSGFGGLTVMKAVKSLLPKENIIYFGDTMNVPYGNKNQETILKYCLENIRFLENLGIKLLIIACHTVSTTMYQDLQKLSAIPILGMVDPSISLLQKKAKYKTMPKIAILGTKRTIDSGIYQSAILSAIPKASLIALPCPLFVPLVEDGYADHPIAKTIIQECLSPIKPVDMALLACTHYPLLQKYIQNTLGSSSTLLDPAIACAEEAQSILNKNNLLNDCESPPKYLFYVSGPLEKFSLMGEKFLKHPIHPIFSTKTAADYSNKRIIC